MKKNIFIVFLHFYELTFVVPFFKPAHAAYFFLATIFLGAAAAAAGGADAAL
jgi:hypothetical protein